METALPKIMTEQIAERIWRIPVPLPGNPLKELNAYLLLGGERELLIDTGFRLEACREALWAGLAEHGLKPGEVEILLTHLHSDHSGLAPEAAGERSIYISKTDRPSLSDAACRQERRAESDRRYYAEGFPPELLAGVEQNNPARSMAPLAAGNYADLEDGQTLEAGGCKLICLSMPGHTPGQMCFLEEREGILFTGDHVLFDITPNITAWAGMEDALGTYLESLKRIRPVEHRLALPGHRKGGDLKKRVDELLDHHRCRLEEALRVVEEHPGAGAYELAGHMTWRIRANSWEDFPVAQKWFAVGECMSHLDYLTLRGLIRCESDGERYHYFKNGKERSVKV